MRYPLCLCLDASVIPEAGPAGVCLQWLVPTLLKKPMRLPTIPSPHRVLCAARALALGCAAALLLGCAQLPKWAASPSSAGGLTSSVAKATSTTATASVAGTLTASTSAGTATTATAARPGDPPPLRPFAEVIRDAKRADGFLPIWTKDERVWLEIPLNQLGQPFMLSVNISNSLGERGLYASQMGPSWMVEFRKLGNTVQLLARNTGFRAGTPGAPSTDPARALLLEQGFSDSLLASMPQASAPHAERKSILVDAAFLLADIPNYGQRIEQVFRIGYGLDRSNSQFTATRAEDDQVVLSTRMHFATGRLPAPPPVPVPGVPGISPPSSTPDARSFFVGYVYSLARLPAQPMATRLADPRLGHFHTSYTNTASDASSSAKVFMLNRWRLEKKDPAAAMSEPVKPITFWIDKNVPQKYRSAVEQGILEWNKAFEAIGFKNAVVASHQPHTATWDTLAARQASVRWYTGVDVGSAIGPSQTDPRTGEILDADIAMHEGFARGARRYLGEGAPESNLAAWRSAQDAHAGHSHFQGQCNYGNDLAQEFDFAHSLLEVRGEIEPGSPEAEGLAQAAVKNIITHEVGHTLGLKHNFKASTSISRAALQKPGPISGSVMDYNPFNVPLEGEPRGDLVLTGLGAYDYWAIAYAYSQFSPGNEAAELAKIAARSTERALAYGDDADAGGGGEGTDPDANRYDAGDDPLAYYQRRLKLSQELWARLQKRGLRAGDEPARARRGLNAGFAQLGGAVELVGKYVGGMHVVRDLPGTTARSTFTPVDPEKQRQALGFITQALFNPGSFEFNPEFLNRLGMDFNEWRRDAPYSVAQRVNELQTTALDKLMNAGTAARLLDLPGYLSSAQRPSTISLQEVYTTVQAAVWSELPQNADIPRLRRSLQREHLKRITAALTRPSNLPADALSLLRYNAQNLLRQLQSTQAQPAQQSIETRAHLSDSLGLLTEALRATMQRAF